nr:imaginal disc growth factor 2 [Sogatella furcifera]
MSPPILLLLLASLLSVATTFRRDNVESRPPVMPTSQQQQQSPVLPHLHRYSFARPRFGSTALPLRQAVERVPSPSERAEEHFPIRDAVEQRPVLSKSPLGQWWNNRAVHTTSSQQGVHPASPGLRVAPLVDKAVYCFVESWSAYRRSPMSFNADHIDPHLCTHLVYAFARIDSRTHKLVPVDEEYDIVKGGYRSVVFLKRLNPRLKVLLSVAGPFSQMTSSVNRRTFLLSAVRLLHEYNFDGLDLHWQLPELENTTPDPDVSPHQANTPTPPSTLAALLEEMSTVMEARSWTLTLSVSGSRFRAGDAYPANIEQLASYVTHVLLKSYDLHEERSGGDKSGGLAVHHAPLLAPPPTQDVLALYFNVDYAVRYWLKRGVPRHKLIMGIPLYARTYTLKDANQWQPGSPVLSGGAESRFTQQPGLLAYYEVCEKLVSGDDITKGSSSSDDFTSRHSDDAINVDDGSDDVMKEGDFDVTEDDSDDVMKEDGADDIMKGTGDEPWRLFRDQGNAPFMVKGDQWVGYEDPVSIQTKMRYINQQKLGGVMVWALDLDDFQGKYCGRKYPLLNAINDHLHAYDWPLAIHQPPLTPTSSGLAPPTYQLAPPTYQLAPPTINWLLPHYSM